MRNFAVKAVFAILCVCTKGIGQPILPGTSPLYEFFLQRDVLINADIWEAEPKIIGAGLGFTNILGIPGLGTPYGEFICRAFGGTWNTVEGDDVPLRARTSAASIFQIRIAYGPWTMGQGGLPVEFSWPVQPSTVRPENFKVTLNDGSEITPVGASIFPNFEYNERSTVVLLGEFGNRLNPSEDNGALYPVKLEIVESETPLTLIGLKGKKQIATGFSFGDGETPMTAYDSGNGPKLCAAKISRMNTVGENGPLPFRGALPNDGVALYGNDAQFRLRVLTTGGFSPDGVASVLPTDFERFFRIRCEAPDGTVIWITEANKVYEYMGKELEVLGLAELGKSETDDPYTLAYTEDHDNQIDIILRGDVEAMHCITDVHIPASGDYSPFYNPGGPGNSPTPGTTYTQPGPELMQPVLDAIDHPYTVTWFGANPK